MSLPPRNACPRFPVASSRHLVGGLLLLLFVLGSATARAQSTEPSPPAPPTRPAPPATAPATAPAPNVTALDRITQQNQDLLDLLKKQQAVLEDIQYDRRLQNRQVASLEERLEETLLQNAQLQAKIARLEEQIALQPAPAPAAPAAAAAPVGPPIPPAKLIDPPPAPPSTYLPPADTPGAPGTKSWHRLFTLSGTDAKNTNLFHIQGPQWRVLWHNQDQAGPAYANTSALFINAFPKDDTIPQKVCSKLGSGGDSTELNGPGDYFLKIEASGGSWELAVEDFK
jgi:Spy/CpxP family protein refolding chaperone